MNGPARSLTKERAIFAGFGLPKPPPTEKGVCLLRVLVAIAPTMYRQTLAEYLGKSRPSAEIRTADPEDLDGEVDLFRPHLVLSHDEVGSGRRVRAFSMVEILYSDSLDARVSVDDRDPARVEDMKIEDLLAVLDETEELISGG